MKRFTLVLAAAMLLFVGVTQSQAHVFQENGTYKIKFEGFEYAYFGTHNDFLSGGLASTSMVNDLNQLITPVENDEFKLTTGFNMTAMIYATQISTLGAGGTVNQPALYNLSNPGLYVSILRDIEVYKSTGSISFTNPNQTADMYFKGGIIDWYYLPNATVTDFSLLEYAPGVGLSSVGMPMDLSGAELFAQFALSALDDDPDSTGKATVSYKEGHLTGSSEFFADVLDGPSWMNSDKYGNNHDLIFQSDIFWFQSTGRFTIDDPARVDVVTPEPASLALLGTGLAALGAMIRRRRTA